MVNKHKMIGKKIKFHQGSSQGLLLFISVIVHDLRFAIVNKQLQ